MDKKKRTSIVFSDELDNMVSYIQSTLGVETRSAAVKMAIYQYYRILRHDEEIKGRTRKRSTEAPSPMLP